VRVWELDLQTTGGLLVGALQHAPAGVHAASATVDGQAFLPGSALRGALRHGFRRFVEARTGAACAFPGPCTCTCCRVFGTEGRAGRLRVRSAFAAPHTTFDLTRVAIDRTTGAATGSGALFTERRVEASFTVELEEREAFDATDAQLFETYLAWCTEIGLPVGRGRSVGSGLLRLRGTRRSDRSAPHHAPGNAPTGDRRRAVLVLTAVEPLRLAGVRPREFLREALPVIPATTLAGAVGWALAERGGDALAADLFEQRPIRLSNGVFGRTPPAAWAGAAECRGCKDPHDPTAAVVVQALGGATDPTLCPRCGDRLRPGPTDPPPTLVLGHTAIDPHLGRAAGGQLYSEVVVRPGCEFRAFVDADDDQIDMLTRLGSVLTGGSRARGLGRCDLRVEPADPADLSARIQAQRQALHDAAAGAGTSVPEDLAILGLLADAVPPPGGLRRWLTQVGCEVVTGWITGEVRGGWDERAGTPRPLQQHLAAGSWIAVRASRETLRQVETTHDGPWLHVRDDIGGTGSEAEPT